MRMYGTSYAFRTNISRMSWDCRKRLHQTFGILMIFCSSECRVNVVRLVWECRVKVEHSVWECSEIDVGMSYDWCGNVVWMSYDWCGNVVRLSSKCRTIGVGMSCDYRVNFVPFSLGQREVNRIGLLSRQFCPKLGRQFCGGDFRWIHKTEVVSHWTIMILMKVESVFNKVE